MKMFITAAALVAWCGLKPRNEESAGKDVYKRQASGSGNGVVGIAPIALAPVTGHVTDAVSYTHLDVYKRQS